VLAALALDQQHTRTSYNPLNPPNNTHTHSHSHTTKPQLMPFTAACPASYPYEWQPVIVNGNGYLFAAAFEGINGAAAAHHCRERCHECMLVALRAGADPEAALRAMWRNLDAGYLGGPLPDRVRAGGGVGGGGGGGFGFGVVWEWSSLSKPSSAPQRTSRLTTN